MNLSANVIHAFLYDFIILVLFVYFVYVPYSAMRKHYGKYRNIVKFT